MVAESLSRIVPSSLPRAAVAGGLHNLLPISAIHCPGLLRSEENMAR
jgi:hypothetical protein